jgi:photosystem II stability/assembly factor-like uncharacterized protein
MILKETTMPFPASRIARLLLLTLLAWPAAPASGIDRWTQYGPSGAAVGAVVLDPRSPSTLWITSDQVYKSEDGGASFHLSASGLEGQFIRYLAVDPGQPGVLYAATWDYGDRLGVYRSQDGGEHWTLVAGGEDFSSIWSLAVAPGPPGAPGVVFVGTPLSLYRSVDGGVSFQPVITFDNSAEFFDAIAPDFRNPGTVYAATLYQRFKSTDFGVTWANLVEDPASSPFVHAFVVAPGDPRILYETGDGANLGATWRSRDGGATWQGPFPFRGEALAVDPLDADTVYGGSIRGLFVSHDGGETFTEATQGVPPLSIEVTGYYGANSIAIDPARPRFALAGTTQGLFATVNRGTVWTAQPQRGLAGNPVTNLRIDRHNSAHWILSSLGSFFESNDRGRTFVPFADSLARIAQIDEIEPDPFVDGRLWALAGYKLYWSRDGGVTWVYRSDLPLDSAHLLLPAPGIMLMSADYGIFRSTDSGHSWHQVRRGPFGDPYHLLRLEQDPRSPRTIYGLGGRSDDMGRTWRLWHKADAIGFDPFRPRSVHLIEGDTLYVTRDGGTTFQVVGHLGLNPLYPRVFDLLFDRDHRDVLYAVTSGDGIRRSRDGGVTWEPLNNGLPPLVPGPLTTLLQDPANGQRFYVMPATGLYRADFMGGPL